MNGKENAFDNLAEVYYASTPAMPEQYGKLLQETFQIELEDSVIDLGCGSGDLALALASFSSFVQGVDASTRMIAMAEKNDKQELVEWHQTLVEAFDFGEEQHKLIIAFESFHLFPNPTEIIRRSAKGLKTGGSLCIGWTNYVWEEQLQEIIKETFAPYGIGWEDWGYWTCPTFPEMVAEVQAGLAFPKQKSVLVETRTSTRDIVNFLFSIDKTASLSTELQPMISQELSKRIQQIYPSGESKGEAQYAIMYCTKLSPSV